MWFYCPSMAITMFLFNNRPGESGEIKVRNDNQKNYNFHKSVTIYMIHEYR